MSFQPFNISYTPPLTIPSAIRSTASSSVATTASASPNLIASSNTVAGSLINQLSGLIATSTYLQAAILAVTAGSGLSLTPADNPDLARALGNLYGNPAPPGISVEMYSNLLDAEIGLMQLQSAIGNDAAIEPSPQNIADISLATKTFEQALISSLAYRNNLVPLLRSLKGDQVIYQNIQSDLSDYPAYTGTDSTLTGTDVSPAMNTLIGNYVQDQATVYGQVFTMLATASAVENDIASVAQLFLSTAPAELSGMIAGLSSLQSLFHGTGLQDLADDMTNYVFVMLLSEVSTAANQMDRLFSLSLAPLQTATSGVGALIRNASSLASQVGYETTGGLKGMVQGNPCSTVTGNKVTASTTGNVSGNQIAAAVTSALGSVSTGIASVASHLNLAINTVSSKNNALQESLRKTISRRIGDQTAQLQTLCSLRNLESMISLASGFLAVSQSSPVGITATSSLQAITQVISNFSSPSGASFLVQGNTVVVTPPSVPPVPSSVQSVLNTGGVGLVTTQNLSSTISGV